MAAVAALKPPLAELDVEAPIRAFAIATMFWGIVGFLVGVVIATQLAFPLLNLDLEWTTFGRLRPLHTSAVIFAFGGNALLGTASTSCSAPAARGCSAARSWAGSCSGATSSSSSPRPSATSSA